MAIKLGRLVQQGLKNPIDFIRIIFNLPKFIRLYYRLFKDRRVPVHLKLILILAFIYIISPIDFIPDLIFPIVGYADDFVVLIAALRYFLKNCPSEIVQEYVERIEMGG